MSIFVNRTKGYFLITSFKVMYSTLAAHSNLQEIFLTNYLDCIRFKAQQSQIPTVMLVRNPYTRLISFFEDKFIRHPEMPVWKRIKYSNDNAWQTCQTIFFPYLNIDHQSSTQTIITRLKDTTFTKFVSCLPSVYQQDPHLTPQTTNIRFQTSIDPLTDGNPNSNQLFSISLKVDRTIKMENLDRDYFQQELDLDLNNIINRNPKNIPWTEYFNNSQLLQIVNKLYKTDFNNFNYPQHTDSNFIESD